MTFKAYFFLAAILMFVSCGTEDANTELSLTDENQETTSYDFKEGEQIHWETSQDGEFLIIKAYINTKWNAYSVYNTNFLGPLPTLISFEPNEAYELIGDIQEEGLKTKFDEESESEIGYFEDVALFKQKINVNSGEEFVLKGNVNYMICNATKCLPPADYSFELTVKP